MLVLLKFAFRFWQVLMMAVVGFFMWISWESANWYHGTGSSADAHAAVSEAIDRACRHAVEALPARTVEVQPTLVLPLHNDPQQLVTQALRQVLTDDGRYVSREPGYLLNTILWWKGEPVTETAEAVRLAKKAKAEFVILGSIRKLQLARASKPSAVELNLQLLNVQTGKVELPPAVFTSAADAAKDASETTPIATLTSSSASDSSAPMVSPELLATTPSPFSSSWYVAGLLAFCMVWPLSLMPVMRRVVKAESNGMNLLALTLIIAVPVVLGAPWAFEAGASAWKLVVFAVGAIVVALWCIYVMSEVAEINQHR